MNRYLVLLPLALSACVQHTWAPGPTAAVDLGRASGQCKLVAMGVPSAGFVGASGSPQFVGAVVGASVVAGVIGTAVRQQNAYNACMEASGFVAVDPVQQQAAR